MRPLIGLTVNQSGTVAVMMALLLPLLVGTLGVGFEISNWYLKTRAMQNAADAAAIAAASSGSTNYAAEAKAVAAQYGFVDGSTNVTVTASNTATCPAGENLDPPCYSVKIARVVPLYVSQIIGYQGDTTLNGEPAKALSSTAIAKCRFRFQPPLAFPE